MGPTTPAAPRELRIAPVMTGGTSLAVWMGGVTTELYALYRAPTEASSTGVTYAALLDLAGTSPVVDVVTGTSAGGLNGTLLAAAVHLALPLEEFRSLRRVWMEAGDLGRLLRLPTERHPPSLLRGDDHLGATLRDVLQRWWDRAAADERTVPSAGTVDLVTTYTRIRPTPVARLDDFDETLHDVDHAGTLRFTGDDLAGVGEGGRRIIDKLVLASRASSSIPGVFEPVLLPSGAPAGHLPDMAPHQPADVRGMSRWVVDGGILVNLPLRYVLDRIFTRPATGRVRRMVLYVSPTPRRPAGASSDSIDDAPTIAAAVGTVVHAPRAEGIAADVDALRRAGATVAHQRSVLALVAPMVAGLDAATVAELFERYCRRRAERSTDRLMARVGRRSDDRVEQVDQAIRAELLVARARHLPVSVDELGSAESSWAWGISPVEAAGSTVLGLLNRALDLHARALRIGPVDDPSVIDRIAAAKATVHRALARVDAVRRLDEDHWADVIDALVAADPEERPSIITAAHATWPGDPSAPDQLLDAHRSIAGALTDVAEGIAALARATTDRAEALVQDRPAPEIEASARLAVDLTDTLAALTGSTGIDPVRAAQQRLLTQHVVSTLLLDDPTPREQAAELCQISWNAPNALDPARPPADTLAGPELARLGAFVKPSWRANDWFWGRMHGAGRLVGLLVEPRRWWELGLTSDEVLARLDIDRAMIGDELDFLDVAPTEVVIPTNLPRLTAELTRRVQVAVARDELSHVTDAVERSRRLGGREQDRARRARLGTFRAAVVAATSDGTAIEDLPDDRIVELVRLQRIGAETAAAEMSSRLMTTSTVRSAEVARRALTGRSSGVPGARLLSGVTAPVIVIGAWLYRSRSALRRMAGR